MAFDEPIECPLCMEPLDIDDLNFYPCTCGYQICRFCWHRIRTDENSLCPACRKQYQEDPAEFKPLTEEELTKIKKERRQKDVARKQKAAENRRHLANIRVVQKNLVFVVGLSTRLADTEVLKKQDYFGKYGKILKVVINSSTSYAGAQGPSASAYITYTKPEDCLRAIHAVNNLYVDGRTLKASLGTTKYCSHFLKGTQCTKTDCMYLHELGDEEASFTKEEMQSGKHQDYEQKLVDTYLTPLNIHPPPLTTQLSNQARSSVGDGTNVSNGVTSSNTSKPNSTGHRKKTDSGSSNGSGKPKEPWPLLNSNRNSNQQNSTSKDSSDPVMGTTESPSGGSRTKESIDIISNSSAAAVTTASDSLSIKQNGTSHCSPASSCSSSSNPRTPTPEAMSSASPRLHAAALTEDRSSIVTSIASEPAPPVSAAKTLLAVRKLPFSDPPNSALSSSDVLAVHHNAVHLNSSNGNTSQSVAVTTSTAVQSQRPVTGTFGFSNLSGDNNPLLTTTVASDWPTSFDHASFASDDDLGFDPFFESNKGLADMLENETNNHMMSPLTGFGSSVGLPMHPHRPPPGVGAPPHLQQAIGRGVPATGDMFGAGIMPSIVPMSSTIVSSNTPSSLPPPPPGLPAFPQFSREAGMQPANNTHLVNNSPDLSAFRGSRMLGLMNLSQNVNMSQPPPSHIMPQSPINTMPRSPYNDNRMGSTHMSAQTHTSLGVGYPNGITDFNTFNTQELRDSLKALLPNASINFAPNPQHIQHSRLRNNYMQPGSAPNNTSSWNGNISQQFPPSATGMGSAAVADDQFTDPAIVSGCLSSNISNSPPGSQPHWLKSIQQLTEIESSPIKLPNSTQPMHSGMSAIPSVYRQPSTHSRMPFAQNIHMSQPGPSNGGWPTLQANSPPPGFQANFRSNAQNPHMATLES